MALLAAHDHDHGSVRGIGAPHARVGRARSRHENEDIFYTFPARYFEQRTFGFEIHDRIAQGDDKDHDEAEYPQFRAPECRSFHGNRYRASFNNNVVFEAMVQAHDPVTKKGQKWRCTITRNAHSGSAGVLRVGDWVEVELQQLIGIFQKSL